MSTYLKKGKGWRYDFILQKKRHTSTYFKTMAEARQAEAEKREELRNPPSVMETPTDMAFLELVNQRLDYVKAYKSESYYSDYVGIVKRLVKEWRSLGCVEITKAMVQKYLLKRARVSA
jgi:hypothetical protein